MTGKGCFKVGCLGCLGLGVTVALVLGVLTLVAFRNRGEARPERREASHAIPPRAAAPQAVPESGAPGPVTGPGRVVLNLRAGSFEVRPAEPGSPIRVEADFDTSRFRLEERFDHAETSWTYRVTFGPRGLARLIQIGDTDEPRVRVFLPRGAPFALEGSVGMGETELDLGGLWITSVDLGAGMGECTIHFDESPPAPMDSFEVRGSMGGLYVRGLGNASPHRVGVRHRMGELELDLRGRWLRDARVEARASMGELRIRIPRDVVIQLDAADILLGQKTLGGLEGLPQAGEGRPTLSLAVSHTMGELRID